jgi:hypothetical protein
MREAVKNFDTRELFFMLALIKEKRQKTRCWRCIWPRWGLRAVNQLSRTFTAQLEGVKRYLSAPVRNFSVSVAEGGQAIVGDVTQAVDRAVSAATANVTPAIRDAHRVPMEVPRDREPVTMPRVPPAS